jgi:hypothetical protein
VDKYRWTGVQTDRQKRTRTKEVEEGIKERQKHERDGERNVIYFADGVQVFMKLILV